MTYRNTMGKVRLPLKPCCLSWGVRAVMYDGVVAIRAVLERHRWPGSLVAVVV